MPSLDFSQNHQQAKPKIKPFLKWAGGKTQQLPLIMQSLPGRLKQLPAFIYVEPFVGSGAVMLQMLKAYPNIKKAIINDLNPELTTAWKIIKGEPEKLAEKLTQLQSSFQALRSEEERKKMFYKTREIYNLKQADAAEQSAMLIFLNKTCYNGLYRVNRKNKFNVPFGRNRNPKILDSDNIFALSHLLKKVEIKTVDFAELPTKSTVPLFYYMDPPYKPVSTTALFNSYSSQAFNDREQVRLKEFCDLLTVNQVHWLQSNSAPGNSFFDDLYAHYHIKRVKASRMINSKASARGSVSELLISNYDLHE